MPDDNRGLSTGEVLLGAIIVYLLWRQGTLGKIFSSFTAGGSGGAGGVGYGGGSSTGSGAGTSSGIAGSGGCGCSGSGNKISALLAPPIAGVPTGPYGGATGSPAPNYSSPFNVEGFQTYIPRG